MKYVMQCLRIKLFSGLLGVVLLLCLVRPLAALEVPQLTGRVNDTAAMLSPESAANLESLLAQFEATDSTQIVLLTIPSLEGEVLEWFSMRVVEEWKIGQKEVDNGALLLIAQDERKLRIEVGYGLEGSLTDLVAGRIISGVIVPRFKEGRFDQGINDGVLAMVEAVRGEFDASKVSTNTTNGKSDPAGMIFMMIFVFAFIGRAFHKKKKAAAIAGGIASPFLGLIILPQLGFWLLALVPLGILGGLLVSSLSVMGRSGRSGGGFYTGGGGFGGSSGGFGGGFSGGGGGFGGGGASGGW